ncbi:unnamed protein product [Discosporangium mesarthrocarpum]
MDVVVSQWATEEEQREFGSQLIREDPRGFKRVLVLDTDEFWHPVELSRALVLAARTPSVPFIRATMATYWATLRGVISPPEPLRVLWLMDPHRCHWYKDREIECLVEGGADTAGGTADRHQGLELDSSVAVCHHLSYVRTDEEVLRKTSSFAHASDVQAGWFERSWVGWATNHSLTDLHPTRPSAYKRVVSQPLVNLTPALRRLHLDSRKGREGRDPKRACLVEGEGQKILCLVPGSGNNTGSPGLEVLSAKALDPARMERVQSISTHNGRDDVGPREAGHKEWWDAQGEAPQVTILRPSFGEVIQAGGSMGSEEMVDSHFVEVMNVATLSSPHDADDRVGKDGLGDRMETGAGMKVEEGVGEGMGMIHLAIVSNNLESHSQNRVFTKLCEGLPRERYRVEWFTAGVAEQQGSDLVWRLVNSLVPLHHVAVPTDSGGIPLEQYVETLARFDLVLTANSLDDVPTKVLMEGARMAKRPVRVVELCNNDPPSDLYAEAFIAPSHYAAHCNKAAQGIPTGIIYPTGLSSADWVPHGGIRVAFVGRLSFERSPGLFLHTARALLDILIHFLVVGSGPLSAFLEALTLELGLERYVEFCGSIAEGDMPAFLRTLDLVINPIICQTFGISNVEAAVSGVPVVGFSSCGNTESIGDAGVLVDSPSHLALAEAAAGIIRGYEELMKGRYSAMERTMEEHGLLRLITRYCAFSSSIVLQIKNAPKYPHSPPLSFPAYPARSQPIFPKLAVSADMMPFSLHFQQEQQDYDASLYVVSALDGGCGSSWDTQCQQRLADIVRLHSKSLIVFVSGEAWDISELRPDQAALALVATTNPIPTGVPTLHLPNLVTSFGERRTHSPADLLRGMDDPDLDTQPLSCMYSECDRHHRERFFDLLVERGVQVDALGACRGIRSPDDPKKRLGRMSATWHDDAVQVYKYYHLVIAFENSADAGYITEKIANAFLAGAIPVYWGTVEVLDLFNPQSFIHCGTFPTMEDCADRVAQVSLVILL